MEEKFEPMVHKISNMQIGDTSLLGNENISTSLISSDTLQPKTKSDIIKPYIPEDDTIVTSAMYSSTTPMNPSVGEFVDSSELIAESRFDYNDIELPKSK